jgi:TRAP-type transport system periplasmic protein
MHRSGSSPLRSRRRGLRCAAVTASSVLVLAACSAGGSEVAGTVTDVDPAARNGTDAPDARTLTMAHIDAGSLDAPVDWFVEAVDQTSGGALTIEVVRDCCGGEPDVEARLVEAVRDGEFDLGWVGTRVFDTLGVRAFAPLTAPFVLDNYTLQRDVLADRAITGPMLDALSAVGVEGVAVMPGAGRHPLAVEEPLLAPADWDGVPVHTFRSEQNAAAIAALGGTPVEAGFGARDAGLLDGSIRALENALPLHAGNFHDVAPHATVNVTLWPRVSALIAAPDVFAELDSQQRTWLDEAVAAVVFRTLEQAELDQAAVADGCSKVGRYVQASDADLAALRETVTALHAELADDPATADAMTRIQDLAATTTPEPAPEVPDGCGEGGDGGTEEVAWDGPTIPEGAYEKFVTRADALAEGVPEAFLDQPDEFRGIDEMHIVHRFQGGRYQQLANYVGGMSVGDRGTYSYDEEGRLVKVSNSGGCPGCTAVLDWTFEDGVLTLELVEDLGDAPTWSDEDRAIGRFYDSGRFEQVP